MFYYGLLLDCSRLLSISNTEIDYFLKSVYLVLINCLNCTYQADIDYSLFDDYFLSFFWYIVLDLHNIWLVVHFVNESDDHYWTMLSVSYGRDVIEPFLLKHFSHYFEGVFLLWLVFLLCHKMSKFNILGFELDIENSSLISWINMSINNWLFDRIFCYVFNLDLSFITEVEDFFISVI